MGKSRGKSTMSTQHVTGRGGGPRVQMRGSKARVCTPPRYSLLGLGFPWCWKCQMKAGCPELVHSWCSGTCGCGVPVFFLRSYHPPSPRRAAEWSKLSPLWCLVPATMGGKNENGANTAGKAERVRAEWWDRSHLNPWIQLHLKSRNIPGPFRSMRWYINFLKSKSKFSFRHLKPRCTSEFRLLQAAGR